tara:strand:+ start:1058 stop:1381 length:324 start_codon:yes stop_codon:yes gene_type:complete
MIKFNNLNQEIPYLILKKKYDEAINAGQKGIEAISVSSYNKAENYDVSCVEPNINEHKKYNLIDIKKAIAQFDVIALLVNHKEFTSNVILSELESKGTLYFCGTFSK